MSLNKKWERVLREGIFVCGVGEDGFLECSAGNRGFRLLVEEDSCLGGT